MYATVSGRVPTLRDRSLSHKSGLKPGTLVTRSPHRVYVLFLTWTDDAVCSKIKANILSSCLCSGWCGSNQHFINKRGQSLHSFVQSLQSLHHLFFVLFLGVTKPFIFVLPCAGHLGKTETMHIVLLWIVRCCKMKKVINMDPDDRLLRCFLSFWTVNRSPIKIRHQVHT